MKQITLKVCAVDQVRERKTVRGKKVTMNMNRAVPNVSLHDVSLVEMKPTVSYRKSISRLMQETLNGSRISVFLVRLQRVLYQKHFGGNAA